MSNPGIHRMAAEKKLCVVELLGNTDKLRIISALQQFLISCFGPKGKTKYVKNRHGALMALTASSQRLLSNMTLVSPLSQIISTSILQHLSVYSDGGLFMGVFMLSLIEGASREQIHHMICCEINMALMHRCLEAAEISLIRINLSDMEAMLCLVRSVFKSKKTHSLVPEEIDVLSSLVLQILTSALPDNEYSKITIPSVEYVLIPGQPVTATRLVNGVLLDVPRSFFKSLTSWRDKFGGRTLKIALFDTSLDIDKVLIEDVTVEVDHDVDMEEYAIQQMMSLASRLQRAGVDIVGCQKVIHPTLVDILTGRGILCLERLSIVHIKSVQKLTGARLLSSINSVIPADSLGHLNGINRYEGLNLIWLHLTSEQQVTTVILCHRVEACLCELKHIFGVASHVASLAISSPDVVLGRGRFEALMASKIRAELPVISKDVCARVHCSSLQFRQAAEVFVGALEQISTSLGQTRSDSTPSEVPSTGDPAKESESSEEPNPAGNGMSDFGVSSRPEIRQSRMPQGEEDLSMIDWDREVVDLWEIKRNALRLAVEMANMILSVGCIMGPQSNLSDQ